MQKSIIGENAGVVWRILQNQTYPTLIRELGIFH